MLCERFRLSNQHACLLHGCFCLGGGISFDMDKRSYERDLKLDLFATQRRSRGQGRDEVEGSCELLCGFNQC